MAQPRPDIVLHGEGTLFDGEDLLCHVHYTLYQQLQGNFMLPFRGSVVVREDERLKAAVLGAVRSGRILSLHLEAPLENGDAQIDVGGFHCVTTPEDGLYEMSVLQK